MTVCASQNSVGGLCRSMTGSAMHGAAESAGPMAAGARANRGWQEGGLAEQMLGEASFVLFRRGARDSQMSHVPMAQPACRRLLRRG